MTATRIKVDGFYDDAVPPTKEQWESVEASRRSSST